MSDITINPAKRMTKAETEMHEKAIIDNIEDSGMRLLKIREERGWEALDFKNFTDYAKSLSDRMSIGKVWGLVDQAEVNRNLSKELGRPVHLPMRHALAIKDLEPEKQVEAFQEATRGYKKGSEKPSEKLFQRAAAKVAPAKKKAKKTVPGGEEGWFKEDLAKDKEVADAFVMIEQVFGAEDTKAIRNGTVPMKRSDLLYLAKLPKERMAPIQDLLFETRWSPQECIKFLNTMPDDNSTVEDLKHLCLTTRGKFWQGDFDGYTVSVKFNKAAKR